MAMDEEWGWELTDCTREERVALSEFYSAAAVAACNLILTAVNEKQEPVAWLCAEVHGRPLLPQWHHWMNTALAARKKLEATEAGRDTLAFYEKISRINGSMLSELRSTGWEPECELHFFIASPRARGLGAGRALMSEFLTRLGSRGISCAHLFTDNHCHYQFYDKAGWTRQASRTYTWNGSEPIEAYTYVKDL